MPDLRDEAHLRQTGVRGNLDKNGMVREEKEAIVGYKGYSTCPCTLVSGS